MSALLAAVLISVVAPAAAQSKFITLQDAEATADTPCELASLGSLVIEPGGDLTVTVADLESCIGTTDGLNVSPLLVVPNPVIAGNSFNVVWTSVGPDVYACAPSVSSTLPEWSLQPLGTAGPTLVTVNPARPADNYLIGVTCTDGETPVTSETFVQVNEPDVGDPPPAPSLTVNGSSVGTGIEPGNTLTVAWSSTDATNCLASGTFPGWSGSKAVSGSQTFTNTASLPVGSNLTVQLSCSNAAGASPLVSRSVTIQDPGSELPAGCETRPLLGYGSLSSWVRKTTGANSCVWSGFSLDQSADCRHFGDIPSEGIIGVWPAAWPSQAITRNLTISGSEGRQFIAMEFNSGNIPFAHQGRMTQEIPQFAGANAGNKLWSISKCPGDYNLDLIDAEMGPGCVFREQFGFTQSFDWGGPAAFSDSTRCALQPNTDYFFNIIWTSAQPGTPPDQIEPFEICKTARCGMNATPGGTYVP